MLKRTKHKFKIHATFQREDDSIIFKAKGLCGLTAVFSNANLMYKMNYLRCEPPMLVGFYAQGLLGIRYANAEPLPECTGCLTKLCQTLKAPDICWTVNTA